MAVVPAEAITFEKDPDSTSPVWLQLRKRIVFLIESGVLKAGDQLPKIRELAATLSINFNTVNRSYLSLATDGYVESIRGKGAFVKDVRNLAGSEGKGDLEAVLSACVQSCRELGLDYDEISAQMARYIQRVKRDETRSKLISNGMVIEFSTKDSAVERGA